MVFSSTLKLELLIFDKNIFILLITYTCFLTNRPILQKEFEVNGPIDFYWLCVAIVVSVILFLVFDIVRRRKKNELTIKTVSIAPDGGTASAKKVYDISYDTSIKVVQPSIVRVAHPISPSQAEHWVLWNTIGSLIFAVSFLIALNSPPKLMLLFSGVCIAGVVIVLRNLNNMHAHFNKIDRYKERSQKA